MKETMMAANLHAVGDLRYEEVPMPKVLDDEVLLAVKYCGICGSDVGRVLTKGTYHFPTIPGHEFAGVIEYDPKGEWTGKKAAVFPLLPCNECEMCKEEHYELCSHYDYYGSRRDGGYAEYLSVKRWNVVLLPENVSTLEGAVTEPASVAHHAVSRMLEMKKPNGAFTAMVTGAGPIGLLAAQWLKAYGATNVYMFDIDPSKITYAKELGFDEFKDGTKVDYAVEGTGFDSALTVALDAVKPLGGIVLMGNPSRPVTLSQDAYWNIMRKQLYVTGTWNSGYGSTQNDWKASVDAMASGKLNVKAVISHVIDLKDANEAFKILTDRNVFKNRVILKTGEE